MAALGAQSIASSYEQLLHVDRDGGGNTTTHVSVKDGDNGTTFGFTIATDALMMSSTNRLEFGDTGTYIHQSADGVLDLVSDTEIEINATTIDMNGALDVSGTVTVGADGSGTDVIFYSGTAGDNFTWDASEECLTITGTDGAQALKIADGDLVVVDKLYIFDNDGGEYLSGDGTDLTITAGTDLNLTAGTDINVPVNVGLRFGDGGENIETDNTDFTITSGGKLNLTATSDVHVANGTGLVVGNTAQVAMGEVTAEAQILGTTETDATLAIGLFSTTDALSPSLKFVKGGHATIGSNTTVADNEELGKIQSYGSDGTDHDTLSSEIAFNIDDDGVGAGTLGGEILLKTSGKDGTLDTAVTIDSSQNVGIGGSPTAITNHRVLEITNTGSNGRATLALTANTGEYSNLYMGDSGDIDIGGIQYYHGTNQMDFYTNTASRMTIESGGDIDIQTGDIVFSTAGKGICLGVTSNTDSNTLDDYEEGTWTMTANNSVTLHAASDLGSYTKVGRLVTCEGQARVNDDNSTAELSLNLPFTSVSTFGEGANLCVGSLSIYQSASPASVLWGVVQNEANSIILQVSGNKSSAATTPFLATANGYYTFSITYLVA